MSFYKRGVFSVSVLSMIACSDHHKPLGEFWTNVVNSSIEVCADQGRPIPEMFSIRVLRTDEGYYLLFTGAWHKGNPPGATRLYKLSMNGKIEREMGSNSFSLRDNDASVYVNNKKCQIVQEFMRLTHAD